MVNVRYIVILAMMAVGIGVLAGFLVTSFDFTPHRNNMIALIGALILLNIVLIYIAYKRGRLKGIALGE